MQPEDWQRQWETHAYNFRDGLAHIDFATLGLKRTPHARASGIQLCPGAGFGDFSHPTTRLVLRMMHEHVSGKEVLDVGCGSGILSVAAAALGAKSCYGIDIDDEALQHARENARLNHFEEICHFGPLAGFAPQEAPILLMNMIRSEQKQAMPVNRHFAQGFTSGILKEERATYLTQIASWGYKCLRLTEEDGWLGFHIEPSSRAV